MKFSIRDLLLVTVIVTLAIGWWLDRSRLLAESQLAKARLEFEKSLVTAEDGMVKALAAYAKARAEFDETLTSGQLDTTLVQPLESRPTYDEGPVLGYKLLGPPPKHSEP